MLDDLALVSIAQYFARQLGVPASDVTVTVEAASARRRLEVVTIIHIEVRSSCCLASVASELRTSLATPEQASTLLTEALNVYYPVAVKEVPVVSRGFSLTTASESPGFFNQIVDTIKEELWAQIAAGSAVLLLALGICVTCARKGRRGRKRSLEDFPGRLSMVNAAATPNFKRHLPRKASSLASLHRMNSVKAKDAEGAQMDPRSPNRHTAKDRFLEVEGAEMDPRSPNRCTAKNKCLKSNSSSVEHLSEGLDAEEGQMDPRSPNQHTAKNKFLKSNSSSLERLSEGRVGSQDKLNVIHSGLEFDLPAGWEEFQDGDSKYYFNAIDKTTSWTKPTKSANVSGGVARGGSSVTPNSPNPRGRLGSRKPSDHNPLVLDQHHFASMAI